jgi:hypothetical protein
MANSPGVQARVGEPILKVDELKEKNASLRARLVKRGDVVEFVVE